MTLTTRGSLTVRETAGPWTEPAPRWANGGAQCAASALRAPAAIPPPASPGLLLPARTHIKPVDWAGHMPHLRQPGLGTFIWLLPDDDLDATGLEDCGDQ